MSLNRHALIIASMLTGCGPSCAELGGKEVQTGTTMLMQWMQVGSMQFPIYTFVPTYECVMPKP